MDSAEPVIVTSRRQLQSLIEAAVERAVEHHSPRLTATARNRPDKRYLTNAEAMAYLGLSRPTLARYRASGKLPYRKVGASIYYLLDDIESLIETGTQRGS